MTDTHRAALEYDWRTRFGLPFSHVGTPGMSWGEAVRLVGVLAQDPASQLCAAVNEWKAPRTPEWLVLADLYDAYARVNSKQKPTPYPRPFPDESEVRRGRTTMPRAQVIDLLNRIGHNFEPEGGDTDG